MRLYSPLFSQKPPSSARAALRFLTLLVLFIVLLFVLMSCSSKKVVTESQDNTAAANIKGMSEAISSQLAQYHSASFDSLSLTITFPWNQSADAPAMAETAYAYALHDSLSMLLGSGADSLLMCSDSAFLNNRYANYPSKGKGVQNNVQNGSGKVELKIYGSRKEESAFFDYDDDCNFYDSTNIVQTHWEKKKSSRPTCNPAYYFLILLNVVLFLLLWYLYRTFWKNKGK